MANYPWYGIVEDDSLEQGDFFFSCPILETTLPTTQGEVPDSIQSNVNVYDVLVLSQSCDLVQGKLETALVCPHWKIEDFEQKEDYLRSTKGKENVRQGNVPGFHMIAACDQANFKSSIRLISFRQVFTLPLSYLNELAHQQSPRLRLLPPYREHLAQAFARFIMRVGLPVDIPAFK